MQSNILNMNNLFVCHSQAQLILACGLISGRFKQDTNYLILFVDFNINETLKSILVSLFYKVLFLQGTYPAKYKTWESKLKRYPNDIKKIRNFIDLQIDRLFEVCDDCIPELYILKRVNKGNPQIECAWLEDGSFPYFKNTEDLSGFSSNLFMRNLRKVLIKYIAGYSKYYDFQGAYMGSNRLLKYAYLTFPGLERKEYKNKDIVGITPDEFCKGLLSMYPPSESNRLPANSVIFVMDKLDVYKNIKRVGQVVGQVIHKYQKDGKQIFYKYHPREENFLDEFQDCQELNRFTGIENFYSANIGNALTVVGIKSTGLQNARKVGFNVLSLASIVDEADENVMAFYEAIGINIMKESNELI